MMNNDEAYRPNVAAIIVKHGKVLLFQRINQTRYWQFPQGGIDEGESDEDALWRELKEETGLGQEDVKIISKTSDYIYYDIPQRLQRIFEKQGFIGQKQMWFLLEMSAEDELINLDLDPNPEFHTYAWCSYWSALSHVIDFKKEAYRQALTELSAAALELGV